tara:strand:- start:861 stop:1394 length:534 start_codon:yes stop_codon:yes gene_type:complete
MNKYLYLNLLFLILINACAKHNRIDFTSSKAFFSSLNEKEIIQKEKKKIQDGTEKSISKIKNVEDRKIKKTDSKTIKKPSLLTLSSYKKQLQQKIGIDENNILIIFNNPSLKIKHGKIKNIQFHAKSCHLDLFFLNEDGSYKFKHFEIRPSKISSILNKNECVKELNTDFNLIHDPK